MASYSSRIREDSERWMRLGYIDENARKAIIADAESRERRSFGFGSVLAIMAALLLGAALLILVASNWEAIPRLGRAGALFVVIFAGYVGGAVLKGFDHAAFGEALWLIATAAFGASIALIGQMYHISGDETQAILVWACGATLAAAVLRSGPLTMAATAIAAAWLFFDGIDLWRSTSFPHGFIVVALALWLVSLWTRSVGARHLLLLSLVLYGALLASETGTAERAMAMAGCSAVIFAIAVAKPDVVERLVRLNGLLPLHGLVGFLTGMYMLQFEISDGPVFALAAAVTLAGIVVALVLARRVSCGIRWTAYFGFAAELCLVYTVMIQGMFGTAGFFLLAGLALGVLAFVIIRIEGNMAGGAA